MTRRARRNIAVLMICLDSPILCRLYLIHARIHNDDACPWRASVLVCWADNEAVEQFTILYIQAETVLLS